MYLSYLILLLLLMLYLYFFTVSNSFLSSLMVLESMVLLLLILTALFSMNLSEGINMFLFVLTLSVCEATLGLTLLISLVKFKGNDLITPNF
uniref:NADH dehydrogenase subunit 4L n=1 Tax=Zaptyx takarai TaxID=1886662 RepID=A0A224AAL6_9EUPU|nr:NADH dehydrogenase subunit 4L [Zaptyx takarai]